MGKNKADLMKAVKRTRNVRERGGETAGRVVLRWWMTAREGEHVKRQMEGVFTSPVYEILSDAELQ